MSDLMGDYERVIPASDADGLLTTSHSDVGRIILVVVVVLDINVVACLVAQFDKRQCGDRAPGRSSVAPNLTVGRCNTCVKNIVNGSICPRRAAKGAFDAVIFLRYKEGVTHSHVCFSVSRGVRKGVGINDDLWGSLHRSV